MPALLSVLQAAVFSKCTASGCKAIEANKPLGLCFLATRLSHDHFNALAGHGAHVIHMQLQLILLSFRLYEPCIRKPSTAQ